MTVKEAIEDWLARQEDGIIFRSNTLWAYLFGNKIARRTVTNVLKTLADEGKVTKSDFMKGRNATWKVTHQAQPGDE